jgi:hypothetical protein
MLLAISRPASVVGERRGGREKDSLPTIAINRNCAVEEVALIIAISNEQLFAVGLGKASRTRHWINGGECVGTRRNIVCTSSKLLATAIGFIALKYGADDQ